MDDLISRDDAIKDARSWVAVDEYEKHLQKNVVEWLKQLPPAQPEIVRCKGCKYADYMDDVKTFWCSEGGRGKTVAPDDFCSYAERREANHESD